MRICVVWEGIVPYQVDTNIFPISLRGISVTVGLKMKKIGALWILKGISGSEEWNEKLLPPCYLFCKYR